jgi:hypothetical protein
MTAERVYALLIEANPVPDPDAYLEASDAVRSPLHLVESRRDSMKTEEDIRSLTPEPPARRTWPAAVAAAIIIVIAVGAVAWFAGGDEAPVVDEAPPITTGEVDSTADALATTEAFLTALAAGDIAEVERTTNPGGQLSDAERRLWGFYAALFAAGYGDEFGTCTTTPDADGRRIAVACPSVTGDPVMIAVGITELVWPFDYFPESRRLAWRPFEGGDFSLANAAAADYLRAFHRQDYDAACDPAAYNFQGVVMDRGLAFTGDCGQLLVPLLEDIATWIGAGQPLPQDEALATTEASFAALAAADIDEVERVTNPGGELSESERRMWGFNAATYTAGYGMEPGECTATNDAAGGRVAVRCPVTVLDPVFNAVGITELVMPFDYFPETGRLAWRPFEGGDVSLANAAMADYLRAFHREEYDAVCDPAAYNFQQVVFDRGVSLTPECGELVAPLLEDIAVWVEAGRPTDSTG